LTTKAANQSIASGNALLSVITSDSQAANVGGSIALGGQSTDADWVYASLSGRSENNSYAGYLAFATSASGGQHNERMRITSAGLVGIGTTSPATLLNLNAGINTKAFQLEANNNFNFAIYSGQGGSNNDLVGQIGFDHSTSTKNSYINFYRGSTTTGGYMSFTVNNNSEAVRIDSSGRLLVGTSTSGTALLQVNAQASASGNAFRSSHRIADSGTGATQSVTGAPYISYCAGFNAASNVPAIVINGEDFAGGNNGLQLELNYLKSSGAVASGDRLGRIAFGGDDGTNILSGALIDAFVDGTPGANDMPCRLVFSTTADGASSPTEAMRINNQRELLIGTTTRTANGGVLQVSNGITFPATAVACTDANTLDDYEEGTWTPTVIGTTTAGTVTYAVRNARYTKIGRTVFVETLLNWSAGTGTGNLRVGDLPFTSGSSATTPALALTFCSDIAMTASHILTARIADNSTQIEFLSYPSGGGAYAVVAYDGSGVVGISGSYTV
jgi:hypothetical protein